MISVHSLLFNMGKSHHFTELFKNKNEGIVFKTDLCICNLK